MRDVRYDLHRALVEKETHLLGDLAPRASWIVPENNADDREQNENERRERKDRVVRERRPELGRLVIQPFRGGLLQELEGGAEEGTPRWIFFRHSR